MFEAPTAAWGEARALVRALCEELEPDRLPADQLAEVVDACVELARMVDGALTRLAAPYDRSGRWKDAGAPSAAEALARGAGAAPGAERKRVAASAALAERPALDDAVRTGAVSGEQAATIAASAATQEAEQALVRSARTESHRSFLDAAARARAAGDADAEARRRRIHRARSLRTWTDPDGTGHLHVRDLPERIAEIRATLQPAIDETFATARRQGRREPVEAYAADALHARVALDVSSARRSSAVRPERKVVAVVDAAALRRGWLEGEETCEIAGVGPVSVTAARSLLGDGTFAVVVRDGVDIANVTHLGRRVTAHQRTALEARGYRCEVVGCGATHRLDIDHIADWALTERTELDRLAWLCRVCHDRKTRGRLELVGPPGRRTLREPSRSPGGSDPPSANRPVQDELFTTAT